MAPVRPHLISELGRQAFYRVLSMAKARHKEYSEIFFTREPFSRFVGSYRDKIERLTGRQYYYDRVTRPILQLKYPNTYLPLLGEDWNHGATSNLKMSFQNFVEYHVGDPISGYDVNMGPISFDTMNFGDLVPNCTSYDQCGDKIVPPSRKKLGEDFTEKNFTRKTAVFDIHFDRQVGVCGVCRYKVRKNVFFYE